MRRHEMVVEFGIIVFLCIMLGLVVTVARRLLKLTEREKMTWL